ncbi:hypothetical protein NKH18_14510 [Streptomyces sp. M10(2022)]
MTLFSVRWPEDSSVCGAPPPHGGGRCRDRGCALLLSRIEQDTPIWYLLVAYVLFGIGFGMLDAPITYSAVSGMPDSRAGWPQASPPPAGRSGPRSGSP